MAHKGDASLHPLWNKQLRHMMVKTIADKQHVFTPTLELLSTWLTITI